MTFHGKAQQAFQTLNQSGLGVIDIGSRDGLHRMFQEVASLVVAVGFEPDREECDHLQSNIQRSKPFRSLNFLPFGLGKVDGQQMFYLCRSRGTSSLYRPNRLFLDRFPDASRFDIESTLPVPIREFDGLLKDSAVHLPSRIDFMKVDTQGSELDILQGARETLQKQVVAVQVEVEFAKLYESQPLFRDLDSFLSECGFTLFKLRRVEWVRQNYEHCPRLSAGQLVFGDALYLKDPFNTENPWTPEDSHQAEALILVAALYDLHDVALEILSTPRIAPLLDSESIREYVNNRASKLAKPWSHVHTLRDLFRLVRDALHCFTHHKPHWARGDDKFYSSW